MALHFELFGIRCPRERLLAKMAEEKLDAVLLFAQESMYWLTGYDTFGYCFFQTLVVKSDGSMTLLTRSADLRQARNTSSSKTYFYGSTGRERRPHPRSQEPAERPRPSGCQDRREYDTHGMTGRVARLLDNQLASFGQMVDASYLVSTLRLVKSPAEIAYARKAGNWPMRLWMLHCRSSSPARTKLPFLRRCRARFWPAAGTIPPMNSLSARGGRIASLPLQGRPSRPRQQDQLTLEWAGVSAIITPP